MTDENKMNPYKTLDDIIGKFCISVSKKVYNETGLDDKLKLSDNRGLSWLYCGIAKIGSIGGAIGFSLSENYWETLLGVSAYILNGTDMVDAFGHNIEKAKIEDPKGYEEFERWLKEKEQKSLLLRSVNSKISYKISRKTSSCFEFIEKGYDSIYRGIRLPILLTSTYYMGRSAIDIYNLFSGDRSEMDINRLSAELFMSVGLLSWSSAMYLRDPDKEKI